MMKKRVLLFFSMLTSICLAAAAQNQVLSLYFDSGSFTLTEKEQSKLNTLQLDRAAYIVINGYSSMMTEQDKNNTLSWRRADTVRKRLKKKYAGSIRVSGLGPDMKTQTTMEDSVMANYTVEPKSEVEESFHMTDEDNARDLSLFTAADTTSYTMNGTMTVHTVADGETLTRVSLRYYGTKKMWPYIAAYNHISEAKSIQAGQMLNVPVLTNGMARIMKKDSIQWRRLQRVDVMLYFQDNPGEERESDERPVKSPREGDPENTVEDDSPVPENTVHTLIADSVTPAWLNASPVPREKKIVFMPRTNLLLPLCNVGLEFPVGKHLSVEAEVYYPWIGHDNTNSNCFELMFGAAELRYWFRPKDIAGYKGNTFTGHTLAAGILTGCFDSERDKKGSQGEFRGAYLDYAYFFNIAGHVRLGLDVGIGYARIKEKTYTVYKDGGKLIRDDKRFEKITDWFGPVKAGVSLTFPINIK